MKRKVSRKRRVSSKRNTRRRVSSKRNTRRRVSLKKNTRRRVSSKRNTRRRVSLKKNTRKIFRGGGDKVIEDKLPGGMLGVDRYTMLDLQSYQTFADNSGNGEWLKRLKTRMIITGMMLGNIEDYETFDSELNQKSHNFQNEYTDQMRAVLAGAQQVQAGSTRLPPPESFVEKRGFDSIYRLYLMFPAYLTYTIKGKGTCSICLDPLHNPPIDVPSIDDPSIDDPSIDESSKTTYTTCGHKFHSKCISGWPHNCPMCREILIWPDTYPEKLDFYWPENSRILWAKSTLPPAP